MRRSLRVTRAREQRQIMSDSERRLWYHLRDRRFLAYKFRRQVPIGPFIADFACKSARLIIETDGDSHGYDDQELRDFRRTLWLNQNGWRVLRFWSGELASDMGNVLERIFNALEGEPSDPHPDPLPQAGEGNRLSYPHPIPLPHAGEGNRPLLPGARPSGGGAGSGS